MCPLHPELVQMPAVWTAAGLEHTRSHRRLIAGGLGGFGVELAAMRGLRVIGTAGPADEEALAALSSLASAGRLTLRVAGTYPLREAATAFERLGKGGVRGRLVLVP